MMDYSVMVWINVMEMGIALMLEILVSHKQCVIGFVVNWLTLVNSIRMEPVVMTDYSVMVWINVMEMGHVFIKEILVSHKQCVIGFVMNWLTLVNSIRME